MSESHERIILETRPSWAFVLLRRTGLIVFCVIAGTIGVLMNLGGVLPGPGLWLAAAALVVALLVMLCNRFERDGERYRLTSDRAVQESRLVRRFQVEAPIAKLQHAMLYQSLPERLLGIGTIGLATAGSDSIEIVWRMIEQPHEALAEIRSLMTSAQASNNRGAIGKDAPSPAAQDHQAPAERRGLAVIGLAGGIGSGKSTVARELEALGCLVIDSDQRARAALDRPDVRETLVGWWGEQILTGEGKVDRSKVAAIVFSQPAERARLEGLVHPIVRQDRAAMIAEAERPGGREFTAVVIDAPLLFEAGLDKECDAVLFVDAPLATRLARVQEARGWNEAELRRREAAQLDIEEKKRRATVVIDNSGPREGLKETLAGVLEHVRAAKTG